MTGLLVSNARIAVARATGERFTLVIPRLEARPGDRIALIGPSGSGKTTALEFLALLRQPAALDAYELSGRQGRALAFTGALRAGRLDRLTRYRASEVGYVAQSGGLLPFASGLENALTCVRAAGLPVTPAVMRRLEHHMDRLDLAGHLQKRRAHLSGGERKRVAILRALALPRRLLLADEPTAGLDEARAEQAMETLVRTCDADGTICIAAMHDVERAERYGFRMVRVERDPRGAGATVAADPAATAREVA